MFTLQALCPSGRCSPQQDSHPGQRCPLPAGSARTPPQEYLSAAQVQRELGLSPSQLHELITSGRLPAFQILGLWRIERRMLDLMIDELYALSARMLATPSPHPGRFDGGEEGTEEPDVSGLFVEREPRRSRDPQSPQWSELTGHQRQIAALVGAGLSNAEIANRMSLEVSTVKTHVSRILQRTALRDREQLIVAAWRSGFLPADSRQATA